MKDPNKMRFPAGTGPNFREGWRACEAGQTLNDNPYTPDGQSGAEHLALMAKEARWSQGFRARSNEGFETAHLPRKPGGDAFDTSRF